MKFNKAIPLAATSIIMLGGCSEAQTPGQELTEDTIEKYDANREITSFKIGNISVRVLTDGEVGSPMPTVNIEAFQDSVTRLLHIQPSLDEYSDDPIFSDPEIDIETDYVEGVVSQAQSGIMDALDDINSEDSQEEKTWTVIVPSERDSCLTTTGFEKTLPDHSNCNDVSLLGYTAKAIYGEDIDRSAQVTAIAPNSYNNESLLAPLIDEARTLTADQAASSTLSHEAAHMVLSFAGIDTYGKTDDQEEAIIQSLELNGLKNTLAAGSIYPISWPS